MDQLRETIACKRHLEPAWYLIRVDEPVVGVHPELLNAFVFRALLRRYPALVDNLLDVQESLFTTTPPPDEAVVTKPGRFPIMRGESVYALYAWDLEALHRILAEDEEKVQQMLVPPRPTEPTGQILPTRREMAEMSLSDWRAHLSHAGQGMDLEEPPSGSHEHKDAPPGETGPRSNAVPYGEDAQPPASRPQATADAVPHDAENLRVEILGLAEGFARGSFSRCWLNMHLPATYFEGPRRQLEGYLDDHYVPYTRRREPPQHGGDVRYRFEVPEKGLKKRILYGGYMEIGPDGLTTGLEIGPKFDLLGLLERFAPAYHVPYAELRVSQVRWW
jgi:hypothetical protein